MKKDLKKLSAEELEDLLREFGEPRWRVEEIRRWIYARGATEIAAMTSLPLSLRERLAVEHEIFSPPIDSSARSADGTEKLLLVFEGDAPCETVLIPEEGRLTQCLSTQSGCPLACVFCHTGRGGLKRSLAGSEIADQWLTARRRLEEGKKVTNLVFMGMGEPLLNFEEVRQSIEIFTSPWGGAMSPSRITVSTAGVVPGIERMAEEFPAVNLAVSLNAPDDELRSRLMPINRKYPLADLMRVLRRYPLGRRRLTFEYVLLGGVNDSTAAARTLARLLRGLRCKVNLIPFNAHSGLPFRPPAEGDLERFAQILRRAGYPAPVRRSKGSEIAAACGQLGADQR